MQRLAHFGDEDYSRYVAQVMAAKQLARGNGANQNFEILTQLNPREMSMMSNFQKSAQNNLASSYQSEQLTDMLLNKQNYGNQWQKTLHKPQQSQDVQVNTPIKNMAASITVFDEKSGKDVTFQQQVMPNTPIIRGSSGNVRYVRRDQSPSYITSTEPSILKPTTKRPQSS